MQSWWWWSGCIWDMQAEPTQPFPDITIRNFIPVEGRVRDVSGCKKREEFSSWLKKTRGDGRSYDVDSSTLRLLKSRTKGFPWYLLHACHLTFLKWLLRFYTSHIQAGGRQKWERAMFLVMPLTRWLSDATSVAKQTNKFEYLDSASIIEAGKENRFMRWVSKPEYLEVNSSFLLNLFPCLYSLFKLLTSGLTQ